MKSVVSLIVTLSFVAVAVTGLLMMFAHMRELGHVHEMMAIIFTVAAIFHIVLNFQTLICYIKTRPVLSVILALIVIALVTIAITHSPERPHRGGPPFRSDAPRD